MADYISKYTGTRIDELLDHSNLIDGDGLINLGAQTAANDFRIRLDKSDGHVYFEKRLANGTYEQKFEVGGSATVDVINLIEGAKPTVENGEVAIYNKLITIAGVNTVRPYFVLDNGNEYGFVVHDDADNIVYRKQDGELGHVPNIEQLNAVEVIAKKAVAEVTDDTVNIYFKDHDGNLLATVKKSGHDVDVSALKNTVDVLQSDVTTLNDDVTQVTNAIASKADQGDMTRALNQSTDALNKIQTLETTVNNHDTEINRMKTDLATDKHIYTYRGSTAPNIPVSLRHGYYLHLYGMSNFVLVNIPGPDYVENGTIFCLSNEDENNYVRLEAPVGMTIDGSSAMNVNPEEMIFLVKKDDTRWTVAFNGLVPKGLNDLVDLIKDKLPQVAPLTIDQIQAHLKDRLHTFREIQTEFSDQLHSFDAIEADMLKKGFSKGFSVGYGLLDSTTVPQDLSWVDDHIAPNAEVVIPAANQGNKYLAIYMPVYMGVLVDEVQVNQAVKETTESKIVVNELDYTVLVINDPIDTSTTNRLNIEYHNAGSIAGGGIQIDDGTTDAAGVRKINVSNMKLSNVSPDNSEVTLTADSVMTFKDGNTGNDFTATKIQSLDKSIRIANLNGVADFSKGMPDHNEGIHVCLGNDAVINSLNAKSKLYFSDVRVKGGSSVYADMQTKSFVIQDVDPQDDPNVSGGTTFVVGIYFEPDKFTDTTLANDGYIQLELVDETDTPIEDTSGNPMVVRIDYKSGDKVKRELYIGECQAKAFTRVHLKIDAVFSGEEIIPVGSNTQLCLQAITKDESSGLALLSFMAYTGYKIDFDTRYYGYNSMNLAQSLVFDQPEIDFGIGKIEIGPDLYLDARSKIKVSISNYHLNLKDNGTDLPIWSLVKHYNRLDTHFIRGKSYKVTATLTDKDNAFIVAFMKLTTDSEPSIPVVESYNNTVPVFTSGWTKFEEIFITEDVVVGEHKQSKTITIPDDAKQFAIIMYPVTSQIPSTLSLKDLEGDITPWFNKVVITDSSHISEHHIELDDEMYKSIIYTPSGMSGYRYTVNNTNTKLPVGVIKGGDGRLINDNSWTIAGSSDPNKTQGDFKFTVDGTVKMSYSAQCFNEQGTLNQIQFWLAKNNGDGTFTEVPNSRVATTIEANRTTNGKMVYGKQFEFEVKANETYRFFGKSDKSDGFYLESFTNGIPLLEFIIDYREPTKVEANLYDEITRIDEELVIPDGYQIVGTIDQGVPKLALKPK